MARVPCAPVPSLATSSDAALATSASAARLAPGDLLVAMEPAQLRALAAAAPSHPATLLGLWSRPPRPHLEDPYGLSPAYFDTCFEIVDSAVEEIARLARCARTR